MTNLQELPAEGPYKVELSGGRTLEADLVISCVGLTVNASAYKDGLGKGKLCSYFPLNFLHFFLTLIFMLEPDYIFLKFWEPEYFYLLIVTSHEMNSQIMVQ